MHEICSKLKIKTLERRFTHFSGVSCVDFEQANGNINGQFSNHIETSQLICRANQLTGFYMMETLVIKGLTPRKNQTFKTY